jgi:Protein of unknown function (DUF2975)
MPSSDRITPLSNLLFWVCSILAYALPLFMIMQILRGWFDPASLLTQFPVLPVTTQITPFQATLVAAIGVLATYPLVATFLGMRRLFGRYRRGEILSDACAGDVLRIGQALFAVAAMTVLVPTLQTLILTWGNAPGGRILSIGLDGSTLGFLLSGGLLIVIGWVMREAAVVAEDAKGFV